MGRSHAGCLLCACAACHGACLGGKPSSQPCVEDDFYIALRISPNRRVPSLQAGTSRHGASCCRACRAPSAAWQAQAPASCWQQPSGQWGSSLAAPASPASSCSRACCSATSQPRKARRRQCCCPPCTARRIWRGTWRQSRRCRRRQPQKGSSTSPGIITTLS